MTAETDIKPTDERELVLTRLIDAPREKVYRAFTEAELLKQWFAPLPWTITEAELDVRPGGTNRFVMRSPEGELYPNQGVYLEVVPNEKLVMTDAYTEAWKPSEKPFMTAVLTFEDEGGRTRYTARARHWSMADKEAHEKMGFHEGWGQCADQLAALVARL
jgi:uncharacterized protein YndB with AHSA1/START domain